MGIRMVKSGLLTTIQDMGRWDHLGEGVPLSGAMDNVSARIANLAIGNPPEAPVMELTYGDVELMTATDLLMAYSGDGAVMVAKGSILPTDRPLFIPARTRVRFANNPIGSRTYLAVGGGWEVADVLGSKSTYITAKFGGYQGRPLEKDDVVTVNHQLSEVSTILYNQLQGPIISYPRWSIARRLLLSTDRTNIRVVPAHEFTWFDGESVVNFLSTPYTVSVNSNRMGYRLTGKTIRRLVEKELLSTAVTPGTIQVTGEGKLVLLMADCQTTGGYPRIAQVVAVDMPLCAQLKPGDNIYFKETSRNDAEKLYIHREKQLHKLATAITLVITK